MKNLVEVGWEKWWSRHDISLITSMKTSILNFIWKNHKTQDIQNNYVQ